VDVLYTCRPQDWVLAWKLNDWNTAKVRIEGKYPKITTWINDLKVCEFDGEHARTEKYDKEGILEALGVEGSIAVQVHGGKGWPNGAKCRWKNLKVRTI